jgi:O-antigen/teichoic acid export membrane protein
MSHAAVILRNVASNWSGFAVSAVVTLLLTPFVLRHLGMGRYGIWVLTTSIVGYYGLLDLGFRAGVTQYLTRYIAVRDYARASECLSSALVAFAAFGALVATLSIAAAFFAPKWLHMPVALHHEAFWCILIVGLSSAFQYIFFPFAAIFPATQRFDLANLIGVTTRLLTAGGIFLALQSDYGLIGVSATTCGANLLDYLLRWRVSQRLVPEVRSRRSLASVARVREVFSFGAWNFLISINFYAYLHAPNILIAAFMPVAAVGHYSLVTGLSTQINSVLSPVAQVLYPAAADMHARGNHRGLERLYHDGSRLMMLAMTGVVTIVGFYAEDFYRLWIGQQYLSGARFQSVALLLRILLISIVANYVSAIGGQILTGAGHIRAIATALICGSALNLILSITLMQSYGLAGIAWGTVIASIVIDFVVIPVLLQRILGLSVYQFVRRACLRPLAVGMLQMVFVFGIRLAPRPTDWPRLIAEGALSGAGCAAAVLLFGVTNDERQRFLLMPLGRALRKLRALAQPSGG